MCPPRQYIRVYSAKFGRTSTAACSEGRDDGTNETSCHGPSDAVTKMRDTCNGRLSCFAGAYSDAFGDTCPGTYKYLDVHYRCQGKDIIMIQS